MARPAVTEQLRNAYLNWRRVKLQLIDVYKDTRYQATTKVYQYPNGVRLIYTYKPASTDFMCSVIHRAGSADEPNLGLPDGTMHFLEHMLAANPNAVFQSHAEIDAFLFGSSRRPGLSTNAYTNNTYTVYWASCHPAGTHRALEFLLSELDYPIEKFPDYYEKQLKIITAEMQRKPKLDRDGAFQFSQFMYGHVFPEYAKRIIGYDSTIPTITLEHLYKAFHISRQPHSVAIAVQSNEPQLAPNTRALLDEIAQLYVHKPEYPTAEFLPYRELPNQLKLGFFGDKEMQDVFISFNYLIPYPEYRYDYRDLVLRYMSRMLIEHVGHDILREEKQLSYTFDSFGFWVTPYHRCEGYKIRCRPEDFAQSLQEMHQVLVSHIAQFANSDQGKRWLEAQISKYIFTRTVNYDNDYAEGIGKYILTSDPYNYDYIQAQLAAQQMTIPQILEFINKFYLKTPPHIWLVDEHENSTSPNIDIVYKSPLYTHYTPS
jgi:predicted Zn-dependent peptidase